MRASAFLETVSAGTELCYSSYPGRTDPPEEHILCDRPPHGGDEKHRDTETGAEWWL